MKEEVAALVVARLAKKRGMHAVGGVSGLYICAQGGGRASWTLRHSGPDGKRHDMGLGSYRKLTLADAREHARKQHALILQGIDPIVARDEQRDVTVHGFRSTFRNWSAERTSYPRELAELALAHMVGSAVENAYRRTDLLEKRARLMGDWARYCATIPKATGEVVVPIKRGAK